MQLQVSWKIKQFKRIMLMLHSSRPSCLVHILSLGSSRGHPSLFLFECARLERNSKQSISFLDDEVAAVC